MFEDFGAFTNMHSLEYDTCRDHDPWVRAQASDVTMPILRRLCHDDLVDAPRCNGDIVILKDTPAVIERQPNCDLVKH